MSDDLRQIAAEMRTLVPDDVQRDERGHTKGTNLVVSAHKVREWADQLEALARRQAPAGWQDIATAPKEGMFYVTDGKRQMVADGHILALSQQANTPKHLIGFHWTHWHALLPNPPAALPGTET